MHYLCVMLLKLVTKSLVTLLHVYINTIIILGDPGAVSGGGKKSKRARKKIGRRKVKNENRSPWDSSLNRPVPKPFKVLACDWAQKIFLCPIRVQLFSCPFRDFLFEGVHRQTPWSPVRHLFTCSCRRVSLDRKVPLKREPWNRKKTPNLACLYTNLKKHQPRKSDCGLIEGKFLNSRVR